MKITYVIAVMLLSAVGVVAQPPKLISTRPAAGAETQNLGRWEMPGFKFHWDKVKTDAANHLAFEISIPAEHRIFTVVIDDAQGRRVRNLVSMGDLKKFGGDPKKIALTWNRCDELGKPVPPGDYRVHGLSLPGLQAKFDYSLYNPGTPPWDGYPGSGWGGDHSFPSAIACVPKGVASTWNVVVSGSTGEGGDAVIGLDREGRKVWGWKQFWWGGTCVAIADGALWLGMADSRAVRRLDLNTRKPLGFPRPAGTVAEIKFDADIKSLAVGPEFAAVALESSVKPKLPARLVKLDKKTGKKLAEFPLPEPVHLAFAPDGRLIASAPQGLSVIDGEGKTTALELPGLQKPGPLTLDADGNLYVMDFGRDHQVKVYAPDRRLLRTVGTTGGQAGLRFDPQALRNVAGIAVAADGHLWVAEGPGHLRRVSEFAGDGKLVRDFVGNTSYGASDCVLHDQDPTLAYAYGWLFRNGKPERKLTSGPKPGWPFTRTSNALFPHSQLFRSDVSGKMREYFVDYHGTFPVLYVEKDGDYRPIAAVGNNERSPAFPAPKGNRQAMFVWSDVNGDEQVQPGEMVPVGDKGRLAWFYGWSFLVAKDLEFFVGGQRLAPARFTESGAPIYDTAMKPLATKECLLRVGNHLVGAENAAPFQIGRYVFTDLAGNLRATYPINWTGVHGSQHSPLPAPGQTCGELLFSGTADFGSDVGPVIASHGNMGQAFLFTGDGLFISSLFKDGRDGPAGMGERAIKGADWTNVTMSQEPFGGWFGRQDDGKVRYLFGRNAALVCEIVGWEQIRRFEAGIVRLP